MKRTVKVCNLCRRVFNARSKTKNMLDRHLRPEYNQVKK
jgi:hypothetical protein